MNSSRRLLFTAGILCLLLSSHVFTQIVGIPEPGPRPKLQLPKVVETTLDNGLKVVVVEKSSVPLITARVLVRSGSAMDPVGKAGVSQMTADMILKGAGYRDGLAIAQEIDFMGMTSSSSADRNGSSVTLSMTADKFGRGLSILSDSVIRPNFAKSEFLLLKSQRLDSLRVNMKQSGSVLRMAASSFSFDERPNGGTPNSISRIRRTDLMRFHSKYYRPNNSVLILTGSIKPEAAVRFAKLFFGSWRGEYKRPELKLPPETLDILPPPISRILVLDMPGSGQAAVGFANKLGAGAQINERDMYRAEVMNAVLGSGYSSRLNREIRIKRGLSYGVGSSFQWRPLSANFLSVAQTKNESAAEVADLMRVEITRMIQEEVTARELGPRKAVVSGRFSRALQANNNLAGRLAGLYLFGRDAKKLEEFLPKIDAIDSSEIKEFAKNNLSGGDLIIAGDSKVFLSSLRKLFPDTKIELRRGTQPMLKGRILR